MSTHAILLAYDGTDYSGWQRQSARPSIQGELERVLAEIHGVPALHVVGAGRTDAGVHAIGQVASYIPPTERDPVRLELALARLLPQQIRPLAVCRTAPRFHACRSSVGKHYRYRLIQRRLITPFELPFAWHLPSSLSLEAMREGAERLVGRHDFASFSVVGAQSKTTTRELRRLEVNAHDDGTVEFDFEADGFLYRMVRVLTSLLVDLGRGRRSVAELERLLANPKLGSARAMAPPQGLCLVRVVYSPSSAPSWAVTG